MGNCLRGSFSDNVAKNSLDALLMQHQLRDTHELASFAELDNDSIRAVDQTTINLNLLMIVEQLQTLPLIKVVEYLMLLVVLSLMVFIQQQQVNLQEIWVLMDYFIQI